MTEPSLSEQQRAQLYARLAATGDVRPGSINATYRKCGKPDCACARPGHPGHRPRWLWTRSAGGRTRSRQLAAEVDKVRAELPGYGDIGGICRAARAYPLEGVEKEELHTALGYFENNAPRMRYRWFRQCGLFAGSGVVEASCMTIIGQRLKSSGMHWTVNGADAIATLRCHQASCPTTASISRPVTRQALPDGICGGPRRTANGLPASHLQSCPASRAACQGVMIYCTSFRRGWRLRQW